MSAKPANATSRFWGHVGFANLDDPTSSQWFPITVDAATGLANLLTNFSVSNGWLAVETLNNRLVMVDPMQMVISLLDDAEDWPKGDSGQTGPLQDYAGISSVIYRIMAAWADQFGEDEELGSTDERAEAQTHIQLSGLGDRPGVLRAHLRHTRLQLASGARLDLELEHESLLDLLDIEGETEPLIVSVRAVTGIDRRLPLTKIAMIDLPLIELQAARSALLEDDG